MVRDMPERNIQTKREINELYLLSHKEGALNPTRPPQVLDKTYFTSTNTSLARYQETSKGCHHFLHLFFQALLSYNWQVKIVYIQGIRCNEGCQFWVRHRSSTVPGCNVISCIVSQVSQESLWCWSLDVGKRCSMECMAAPSASWGSGARVCHLQ